MEFIQQEFGVRFGYKVYFTTHLFDLNNDTIRSFFHADRKSSQTRKVFVVIDEGVASTHPLLSAQIRRYFSGIPFVELVDEILVCPGGEGVKNNTSLFDKIVNAVNDHGIDRHSYIAAIGGGSVLDVVGYAAAVSHRGIRHIRIPTTVLSQNDSGVGVKNGINFFGKKNFLGTFAPPVAVFNDDHFLTTLEDVDWRSGISEAIKVALIKDAEFFRWLVQHAESLAARDISAMKYLVKRCAELHLQHIAGKDPFETGSSRPLDFGHWSAHKLEQLTGFSMRHGEAVAVGIALDSTYSFLSGRLPEADLKIILTLIRTLGLPLTHTALQAERPNSPLLAGLSEFREHLGGELTIMMLAGIGRGEEVHEMDTTLIRQSGEWLLRYAAQQPVLLAGT